jgi:hypothetical protein
VINVVEQIARMNQVERIMFIRDLVTKWPHLANEIKDAIQIEIFEQREQKEKQELEEYSKMHSDEPLVLTKDMEVK